MSDRLKQANALAKQAFACELGSARAQADVEAAYVRVWAKLEAQVGAIVGLVGYRALVGSSVAVTRERFPWLEPAPAMLRGAEQTKSILRCITAADPGEAEACNLALLTNVLALLCRFIGDDLVKTLLQRTWGDGKQGPRDPEPEGR